MATHWKKEFNYDYMGSYSLPDGKDVVLTIRETKHEMVTGANGKKEKCFVCYFAESDKPMILNRTNCKTISKVHSTPYIEEWKGKKVQLGVDMVNAFGEQVEALRIRNVKPKQAGIDYTAQIERLKACQTLAEMQEVYLGFSNAERAATLAVKDELKTRLA